MNKRSFTLVEMLVSVTLFMLAIMIAVTSVITSSGINARADRRSLTVESARSVIDFIRRESINADPATTGIFSNGSFKFGVYSPEIRQNVCIMIGPGKIGGYGMVGDVGGGGVYDDFTKTDKKIDDYDFIHVIQNYGLIGYDAALEHINADFKNGQTIDPKGTEYAFRIDRDTYQPVPSNNKNKDMYYFDNQNSEFKILGDTNGDLVVDDADFSNVIMNFGVIYDDVNLETISFSKDGPVLIAFAYQQNTDYACQSPRSNQEKNTAILYRGPLHDPKSVKLTDFKVEYDNTCYKKVDTDPCKSTYDAVVSPIKKQELLRINLKLEEVLPKGSKVTEQKKARAEISTSISIGANE